MRSCALASTAPTSLAGGASSRPRQRRPPSVSGAVSGRRLTLLRTLPEQGPATEAAELDQRQQHGSPDQQQQQQAPAARLTGANNAVERRRPAPPPREPLPPLVERVLSSPTLERPDGAGKP